MANTYTQIYLHIIFAVEGRVSLIRSEFEDELHKYITGIIRKKGHKPLAIGGMTDHVHLLLGFNPVDSPSKIVSEIKSNSSRFVNEKGWAPPKFRWQEGYGAFSYSRAQLGDVIHYIRNQKTHHKKRSFREEYIGLLKRFDVDFSSDYLFDWTKGNDG